jgi:hypothetical protein
MRPQTRCRIAFGIASHAAALVLFVSLDVQAQTPMCVEWKSKLKAAIGSLHACEPKYQACLDMGPTNPMRELDYCRNLLKKCESFDSPIGDEALGLEVEQYKAQCS